MDRAEREAKAEEARLEAQGECETYNAGLQDRAAKRRNTRELAKTGKTVSLTLPFSRNRAIRRHPVVVNFEADPNAEWNGSRMFLQRDKKRGVTR